MSNLDTIGLAEEALVALLVVAEARPEELRNRPIMVVGVTMVGPEQQVTLISHREWLQQLEKACAHSIIRLSHPALASYTATRAASIRTLLEIFREICRSVKELQPATPGVTLDSPSVVDSSNVKREIERIIAVANIALEELHELRERRTKSDENSQGPQAQESTSALPANGERLKRIVRQQLKAELKSHLMDDVLIAAYKQYGSIRKAADALTAETGKRVSKDSVLRAVKRVGGGDALRSTESSESVARTVASQRRVTKKKISPEE